MDHERQKDLVTAALEAVLLFHSDTPWDLPKSNRWLALTGTTDVTTKVLCDTVRKVLHGHRQEVD
jgi:hypothetical protein